MSMKMGHPSPFATGKRPWAVTSEANNPPVLLESEIDFGPVKQFCQVSYVGLDDDIDDRRNDFFLDGELLHTIDQGMEFRGSLLCRAMEI